MRYCHFNQQQRLGTFQIRWCKSLYIVYFTRRSVPVSFNQLQVTILTATSFPEMHLNVYKMVFKLKAVRKLGNLTRVYPVYTTVSSPQGYLMRSFHIAWCENVTSANVHSCTFDNLHRHYDNWSLERSLHIEINFSWTSWGYEEVYKNWTSIINLVCGLFQDSNSFDSLGGLTHEKHQVFISTFWYESVNTALCMQKFPSAVRRVLSRLIFDAVDGIIKLGPENK